MGNIFLSWARVDDEPFVKQLYQDLVELRKGLILYMPKNISNNPTQYIWHTHPAIIFHNESGCPFK